MLKLLTLIAIALCVCPNLYALNIADGSKSWEVPIGSTRVHCSSGGHPVLWIASYGLNDVGHTLIEQRTSILYNPRVLEGMRSDALRLFWLGHECGHAFLLTSDESDADCWSAKTGVKQRWFNMEDADQLEADLQDNPGDDSHPTGPVRAAHVKECIVKALKAGLGSTNEKVPNASHEEYPNPLTLSDTFCQVVQKILNDSFNGYKGIVTSTIVGNGKGVNLSLPNATECRIFGVGRGRLNYLCSYDPGKYRFLVKELTACLDNKNGYQKGSDDEYGTGRNDKPEIKIYRDEHGLDVIFSELDF